MFLWRAGGVNAQPRYVDGVFAQSPNGPIELIAYAEMSGSGLLRLSHGFMEDVPTLRAGCRVLVSLPSWKPVGAILSTEAIFVDHRAERRDLRASIRSLNIYAADLEFKDLADGNLAARMLKGIKASGDMPAFVFVIVANSLTRSNSGNLVRFYPIRLDPPPAGMKGVNECAANSEP
jgi:hypothetical protein